MWDKEGQSNVCSTEAFLYWDLYMTLKTVTEATEKNIYSFEMWVYYTIIRIPYDERVTMTRSSEG